MGMVVIQPYILVSKPKKIKTKFLRCTCYLNSIKVSKGAKIRNRYNQVPHLTQVTNGKVTNSIMQDLLLILVLVRQQNFLNC